MAGILVGALVLAAALVVLGLLLAKSQAGARHNLETQAHTRAVLVSGLIDSELSQQSHVGLDARGLLDSVHVPRRALDDSVVQKRYVALLTRTGKIVTHSAGFTAADRTDLDAAAAVAEVRPGEDWAVSNVRPGNVVNLITRLDGRDGERVLVAGVSLTSLSTFIASELSKLPAIQSTHQLVVDGAGVVVGSTVSDRPAGTHLPASSRLRIVAGGSGIIRGINGVRYFDSVALSHTHWTLVLSVPTSQFFATVDGWHHTLPWLLFTAFGIVGIIALALIARVLQGSDRLRAANRQLTGANAELSTAQHALERSNLELERQARELERSNAELDQFASIASHDLQEPLRKVRTFTERVVETESANLSERGIDYLSRANSSAARMQTLIEDLLTYSRVSTRSRPFSAVDLTAVTDSVLDDLSEQLSRSGAKVIVDPLPTINADASQMRQLLQNLISNAVKFRRPDVAPEVRVQGEVDSGWLTLTVADNGIGFDPQYSQRIFRVFERLHGRSSYPGTGIGLALCRKIAERHGGTVTASSAAGEGATFTVTLQTQRTEAVSEPPAPPDPPDPADGDRPPSEPGYVAA